MENAYAKAANRIAMRTTPDDGRARRDGLNDIVQAVAISRSVLSGIHELTAGKDAANRYLQGLIEDIAKTAPATRRTSRATIGWRLKPVGRSPSRRRHLLRPRKRSRPSFPRR